jgi:hypothetical protein
LFLPSFPFFFALTPLFDMSGFHCFNFMLSSSSPY